MRRKIYQELLQWKQRNGESALLVQGARFDEYKDAMFWLSDAMIVNHCYKATEPTFGLNLNRDRTLLKCYMDDTGLLISHAFDKNGIVTGEVYKKLLLDKLEVNMGMVMENMVAQMLTASGHKLYFYSNSSRSDASSRMEIDFLIAKSQISNRHNISPTIKLRFKARQPAVSFSISKLKLLEWESNWPDATSHGLTRPHGSQSAASLIRSIRFAQIVPPSHSVRSCH